MRRLIVLAVVAASLLAACGSSGGGSDSAAQPYVDAMMKSFDKSPTAKKSLTRSEAECVSKKIVNTIGADTLKTNGVTPDDVATQNSPFKAVAKDLTRQQAEGVVNALTDGKCFNFTDLVIKAATSGSGSSSFGSLAKTKVKCLFAKLLADSNFKQAMAYSILGRGSSNAFSSAFSNNAKTFKIFSDCNIKPSELGASGN